jgi:hypothetical protein
MIGPSSEFAKAASVGGLVIIVWRALPADWPRWRAQATKILMPNLRAFCAAMSPELTDTVEKVTKTKLWN